MVPCAPAMAPSAPNRQLVTRLRDLDIAGDDGRGIVRRAASSLSGMTMLIGRRQPAFIGMSSSTITRNT